MAAKKPFSWLDERSSGVLLHPTSLPGDQGIGVLGQSAYGFVDFLEDAGIRYWQTLPLGPTGFGDSPYSSLSAFAGNPSLIDLEPLTQNGILHLNDADPLRGLAHDHVDFIGLTRIKAPLLRLAHKRFVEQKRAYLPNYGLFDEFKKTHSAWLDPYCAFIALKERFSGSFWGDWPKECRSLASARKSKYWQETKQGRDSHAFFQYLFFGQWKLLRAYANAHGVELIGDAPIFVAHDSADAWAHPELFEMTSDGEPVNVAGVPPDYFSETGQLWGNPLYNWKVMEADGYQWWMDRMRSNFDLFDVVRLDHFRGFYDYWSIPAGSKDATTGKWKPGPQDALFKALKKQFPKGKIIAEDLGELHDKVHAFRKRLGMPRMAVLHFAFGGDSENIYLPHNFDSNCVVYPGTHDNDTSRGWYENASEKERDHVRRYLRVSGDDISWDLIRSAYQSPAGLAIFQMQDLLSLGTEARMNLPGTAQGNWQWRMTSDQFHSNRDCASYLKELGDLYGRVKPATTS
jgi:4-alpha-glucanotransferase